MTEIENLRKEVDELKKTVEDIKNGEKKVKRHRPPSEFNKFVGDKIKELKEKNPNMPHKELFSGAVALWNKTKAKK